MSPSVQERGDAIRLSGELRMMEVTPLWKEIRAIAGRFEGQKLGIDLQDVAAGDDIEHVVRAIGLAMTDVSDQLGSAVAARVRSP